MNRRFFAFVAIYVSLVVISWQIGGYVTRLAGYADGDGTHPMMLGISAVYIITAALPFVPGAEIGFTLLAMFGTRAVVLVYFSMIAALSIAFLAGRFMPASWLAASLRFVGAARAGEMVADFDSMSLKEREEYLLSRLTNPFLAALVKHRYLAFALALNLPGNSLAGGGGGLAMMAGMSRLYNVVGFFVTILLAVAPIPLLVLVTGYQPWH